MIKSIVCIRKSDWAIGAKNGLLFSLQKDMEFFKEKTKKSVVFCGENTLLSFPGSKPLPGRSTFVLCPEGHEYDNCICLHDFDETVKAAKVMSRSQDVWIIGGAYFYKSMLPYCDEVYVTEVEPWNDSKIDEIPAEVYFPNLSEMKDWDRQHVFEVVDTERETEQQALLRVWKYFRKLI